VANDTGFVDLGCMVYESYLNVYKGLTMTTEVNAFPAVYGEDVPGAYAVTVTQNGVPVRNLGIIPEFEGVISADPTTDDQGRCLFSIDNISSKSPNQIISFTIDTDYLLELPSAYGLAKDSVILLEQIRTLDKRRLKERIGELPPSTMIRVNRAILISLGFPVN
jgi:hypothetical protein